MAKKQTAPERKVYVTIRSGKKKIQFANWRYWEIFNELRWLGLGREDAHEAAIWATGKRANGDKKTISPEITMEVDE